MDVPITGRRDEAEQVADDLPATGVARDKRRVPEFHEEHGMMQGPRQISVAPEALIGPQDLGQVSIPNAFDYDIGHAPRSTRRMPRDRQSLHNAY
ncbi:MAG TPA: hypothetical protein VF070_31260 [Streptosporangiaceae bacterium]